jgi:hypothetical protein
MKTITKEQRKETMQNRIFSVAELNNQIYETEKVIKKKLHRPKKDIQRKKRLLLSTSQRRTQTQINEF